MMVPEHVDYQSAGTQLYSDAISDDLAQLAQTLEACSTRAGHRFADLAPLAPFLVEGKAGSIAREKLGARARPVRAVLFDKTAGANWSLAWHQDRTVALRARAPAQGFRNWTVKQGIHHAEPPFPLLSRMVTLRLHLDDVTENNAPLMIAPGSHRLGLIPEAEITSVVARCGTAVCLAQAGDVWCYATPILHASAASKSQGHRRVLQVDYSADDLPAPLQWLPT
ncbi:phytanoyl-CoA dioxygenase family protein [Aurantiacibacter odishensis]|uniref:phytanoyl-CoA dioxygenase family protein n=1 Tax=Aurantiacibacter odishensis TaxID=1155476 RepID=UPI001F0CC2B7|nr:phytanoyl-CoA dioxygenase family protein [Aurantiacibacter odishensis]